jgi:hypothetical protein
MMVVDLIFINNMLSIDFSCQLHEDHDRIFIITCHVQMVIFFLAQ